MKSLVAIVGRPNVGKSTLFNRLAGEPLAVVDDVPGTTRDRLVAEAEWNGMTFDMVDTGGIEPLPSKIPEAQRRGRPGKEENPLAVDSAQFTLGAQIRAQAEMAIAEADAVIFMTEAASGVTIADREVAQILRRHQIKSADGALHPPVLLAVNKAENLLRREEAVEFYELGMGDPLPISAKHGIGTGDLLDALVAALPPSTEAEAAE